MKIQKIFISALLLLLLSVAANAAETERFELRKAGDGFLRLDKKTGVVAFCSRDNLQWQCKNVNDDGLRDNKKLKHGQNGQALDAVLNSFAIMTQRFLKFSRKMSADYLR